MWRQKPTIPSQLNICIIAGNFPILGRASDHGFLWPVARGLVRRGHKVTILSWSNPDRKAEVSQDGVRAIFVGVGHGLPQSSFADLALRTFGELHGREPFHVVHSVDSGGALIAGMKKQFGVAVAFDVEATQLSQIFSILSMSQDSLGSLLRTAINVAYKFLTTYLGRDRRLLKSADAMFVTSPAQLLALERYYLYPESKIHIVPYGIEIGDLSPREKSDELRRRLQIPESAPVVATVSDMTEVEEVLNLLRAFERIAIKRANARLIIIGNGPRFKQIEYEMLSLALGSRVVFTGAVSSAALPDYISLADVFVNLSSRTSGLEPSLLEAMAQKKVIIGSEVSPIATIVEDGTDGFLIRPADVVSLAGLLEQIFNGEIDHSGVGEHAREKVTRLFDNERMVQMTLAGYLGAMNRSGAFRRTNQTAWLAPSPT